MPGAPYGTAGRATRGPTTPAQRIVRRTFYNLLLTRHKKPQARTGFSPAPIGPQNAWRYGEGLRNRTLGEGGVRECQGSSQARRWAYGVNIGGGVYPQGGDSDGAGVYNSGAPSTHPLLDQGERLGRARSRAGGWKGAR